METKFLSPDGFSEIESISGSKKNINKKKAEKPGKAYKTVRFVKRASRSLFGSTKKSVSKAASLTADKLEAAKKTRAAKAASVKTDILDRRYSSGRKESNSFSINDISLKGLMPKRRQYAHSDPKEYRAHGVVRKRAVLSIAASVAAVVLSCVTVASALDSSPLPQIDQKAEIKAVMKGEAAAVATIDEAAAIDLSAHSELFASGVYGLYVDGELIGATADSEELNSMLNQYLADCRKDYDDTTVTTFNNDVQIMRIDSADGIDADSLMSAEEVFEAAKDKFSVALATDWFYELDMDYESDVTYDDEKDSDYEKVVTKGETGVCKVNVRLTYIDGVFASSELIDTEVTKEPVNEKIIRGSKQGKTESESTSTSSASSGTATGNFIWPVTHTKGITTYFEMRWGSMHHGIDIAGGGDYGQPIIASDGGTVTWSGYDESGYGNYVIIDHGNGFQTLYGHASELAVSAGQYVAQGETIAYVGSTGFSTGPHLHFEVRVNGERVDPFNYLS